MKVARSDMWAKASVELKMEYWFTKWNTFIRLSRYKYKRAGLSEGMMNLPKKKRVSIMHVACPDFDFETCVMNNAGKHTTVKDVDEANKALRKLQSKTVHLKFSNLGNPSKVQSIAYSDATYTSLPDGSSQGALIF